MTTNVYDCLHLHLHEVHVPQNYPYMLPVNPKRLQKHYDTKPPETVSQANYSVPLVALIM